MLPDAAGRVNISGRGAVKPDMKQFEGIGETQFGEDDDGDDGAVEDSGRHQGEITDDVDQRLVGVVRQLRRAVP